MNGLDKHISRQAAPASHRVSAGYPEVSHLVDDLSGRDALRPTNEKGMRVP